MSAVPAGAVPAPPAPDSREGVIRLLSRRPPLATAAGLAVVVLGTALGLVAYLLYPWAFSPMGNWLSDLGNVVLSPHGSIFFRADMWVVGAALVVFFVGLRAWSRRRGLLLRLLVLLAQASGIAAAIALLMTGVFPENEFVAHALWATIAFIALAVTVWFIAWAVVAHPDLPWRASLFAFAVCAVDVVAVAVRWYWLEWLAVGLLLLFVLLVSGMTHALAADGHIS